MKRCPRCKRTYASDDFTFCLDDGALLSAPYDPESDDSADRSPSPPPKTEVIRTAPPQTQVLPAAQDPTVPSPRDDRSETPALPTLTVPNPPAIPTSRRAAPAVHPGAPTAKTAVRLVYVAVPLVLLIALVFVGLFYYESRCPHLTVTCSAGDNLVGCVTDGDAWFHLIVSRSMMWKVSSGNVRRSDAQSAVFDTTGFAGQQITVTATYQSWWCSTVASTSFLAK